MKKKTNERKTENKREMGTLIEVFTVRGSPVYSWVPKTDPHMDMVYVYTMSVH